MDESTAIQTTPVPAPSGSLVTYTHVVYALHALAVVIGITTPVTIVGAFVFGVPSLAAVVMNYVRRSETRGTYLEPHFRWQIRTFWFTVLWMAIVTVVSAPLVLVFGLGVLTYGAGALAIGVWIAYRVVRGWLALREGRPVGV
jgi:uncharacterized membrane protein